MTGGHLATTLVDSGDVAFADLAASAQYSNPSDARSISSAGAIHRATPLGAIMSGSHVAPGVAGRQAVLDSRSTATFGQPLPGVASTPGLSGGSATVIKLKRHGGAGSSSLARAVQQQLAQRKAATGGHVIDETKNNGVHAHSPTIRSGTSSSPSSSLSPTIGFSDPLKPGVTGRGPIKSRRKSIAKGLDPASAMASMNVAHTIGIHQAIGGSVGASGSGTGGFETTLGTVKAKAVAVRKPRKKKEDNNSDDPLAPPKPNVRVGGGRGKSGGGLGKGKGGRPPMGLGLGKGKGGAYREEMMRRAEVEEFGDESDEDIDDDQYFESTPNSTQNSTSRATHGGNASLVESSNGTLLQGSNTFANDNSALARLVSSALQDQANSQAQLQQRQLLAQQLQQQQQQQDQAQSQQQTKAKKQPRKPSTPQKPPPVRKFGGKSFGMAGGESSGSSSNESSDGEGSGSSGSQSDSSSGSISGSDPGDSD